LPNKDLIVILPDTNKSWIIKAKTRLVIKCNSTTAKTLWFSEYDETEDSSKQLNEAPPHPEKSDGKWCYLDLDAEAGTTKLKKKTSTKDEDTHQSMNRIFLTINCAPWRFLLCQSTTLSSDSHKEEREALTQIITEKIGGTVVDMSEDERSSLLSNKRSSSTQTLAVSDHTHPLTRCQQLQQDYVVLLDRDGIPKITELFISLLISGRLMVSPKFVRAQSGTTSSQSTTDSNTSNTSFIPLLNPFSLKYCGINLPKILKQLARSGDSSSNRTLSLLQNPIEKARGDWDNFTLHHTAGLGFQELFSKSSFLFLSKDQNQGLPVRRFVKVCGGIVYDKVDELQKELSGKKAKDGRLIVVSSKKSDLKSVNINSEKVVIQSIFKRSSGDLKTVTVNEYLNTVKDKEDSKKRSTPSKEDKSKVPPVIKDQAHKVPQASSSSSSSFSSSNQIPTKGVEEKQSDPKETPPKTDQTSAIDNNKQPDAYENLLHGALKAMQSPGFKTKVSPVRLTQLNRLLLESQLDIPGAPGVTSQVAACQMQSQKLSSSDKDKVQPISLLQSQKNDSYAESRINFV